MPGSIIATSNANITLVGRVGAALPKTNAEKDLDTIMSCLQNTTYGRGLQTLFHGKNIQIDINITAEEMPNATNV